MIAISRKFGILFSALLILSLFSVSYADTGPKPSFRIGLKYDISPPPNLTNAKLYFCNVPDCADAREMAEAGPQRITCSGDECSVLAYGFSPYLRLSMEFSDRNRTSNVFQSPGFGGGYVATIGADNIAVVSSGQILRPVAPAGNHTIDVDQPIQPLPNPTVADIAVSLFLTLLIELAIAAAVLWFWKKPYSLLILVGAVNVITVPLLWLLFAPFGGLLSGLFNLGDLGAGLASLLLLEAMVFAAEGVAYWKLSGFFAKKKNAKFTIAQAFLLSLMANAASALLGSALMVLIAALLEFQ